MFGFAVTWNNRTCTWICTATHSTHTGLSSSIFSGSATGTCARRSRTYSGAGASGRSSNYVRNGTSSLSSGSRTGTRNSRWWTFSTARNVSGSRTTRYRESSGSRAGYACFCLTTRSTSRRSNFWSWARSKEGSRRSGTTSRGSTDGCRGKCCSGSGRYGRFSNRSGPSTRGRRGFSKRGSARDWVC